MCVFLSLEHYDTSAECGVMNGYVNCEGLDRPESRICRPSKHMFSVTTLRNPNEKLLPLVDIAGDTLLPRHFVHSPSFSITDPIDFSYVIHIFIFSILRQECLRDFSIETLAEEAA